MSKKYPYKDKEFWICSDGKQFSEIYYANRHEQKLNKKKETKKEIKNENE